MSNRIYPSFSGEVVGGKLKLFNRDKFDSHIASISGKVNITVKKHRQVRSLNQNAYMWSVLNLAGDELGYDPGELHNSFKAMFLTDKSLKIPLVRSTTKLNKAQFGIYLDKIIRVLAEMGIVIPSPEEYYQQQN
jgi:hypothetical protein